MNGCNMIPAHYGAFMTFDEKTGSVVLRNF